MGAVMTTVGYTAEDASGPSNGVPPDASYELPADMDRFAESFEWPRQYCHQLAATELLPRSSKGHADNADPTYILSGMLVLFLVH